MKLNLKQKNLFVLGIIGCIMYMIGDLLFTGLGPHQTDQTIGFMKLAYLEIDNWRFYLSIILGGIGTVLYYPAFQKMHALLKLRAHTVADKRWIQCFHLGYMGGVIFWTYVHAVFMLSALAFKFSFAALGDIQQAAEIGNQIFEVNLPLMIPAFLVGDLLLSIAVIALVIKKVIPVGKWAVLMNPVVSIGIFGNLFALLPWPLNQIDSFSESAGHALILVLGLLLLHQIHQNPSKAENEEI